MNEMTVPFFQHEDDLEEAHRLSFCDLIPLSAATPTPPSALPDHLFEFSAAAHSNSRFNDTIFCGKIIHGNDDGDDQDQLNEFQKRDYFAAVKSQSVRKPSFRDRDAAQSRRLSASSRFGVDPVYHAQRVNISSLTSMSAKSRRRMFMFGPVKFKPEMELSAIKERQTKMAAAAESGGGKNKRHWGVVQSGLRGRSRLVSVLARSLGCIPAASGGGLERRCMGVAN